MRLARRTWVALVATGWLGCGGAAPVDVRAVQSQHVTDDAGLVSVPISVAEGETSWLLTGAVGGQRRVAVDAVFAPDGEQVLDWEPWVYRPYLLTGAVFAEARDVVFNWPVRAEDPPLFPGEWTVVLSVVNRNDALVPGADFSVDVRLKSDADLARGTVKVALILLSPDANNDHVRASMQRGARRWKRRWKPHGLKLEWRIIDADGPAAVADPREGSDAMRALAALADDDELVVIVAADMVDRPGVLGATGASPNALIATERAVIVVPWLRLAGVDGRFNDAEIHQLGDTLAHEGGHFLGLAHPVSLGFDDWDALDDTPDCSSRDECESLLGDNMMYPYPVCINGACTPARALTPDQRGVAHRYVGVQ